MSIESIVSRQKLLCSHSIGMFNRSSNAGEIWNKTINPKIYRWPSYRTHGVFTMTFLSTSGFQAQNRVIRFRYCTYLRSPFQPLSLLDVRLINQFIKQIT